MRTKTHSTFANSIKRSAAFPALGIPINNSSSSTITFPSANPIFQTRNWTLTSFNEICILETWEIKLIGEMFCKEPIKTVTATLSQQMKWRRCQAD